MRLKGFSAPPEPLRITILHTNDIHGRLEAMPRLGHFARRLRAEAEAQGRLVFFWDAGDAADRRLQLCSLSKGAAFMPVMNAMGYQLQTMGNAIALPYGPQAIAAVAARADFPILAANCRDGDSPLMAGLQESLVIDLPAGLKMGVLGLTAPWGTIYEVFGLHLPDFIPVAQDWVRRMKAAGVQLIVILSHLGLEDDRRLVEAINDVDLIIGAHSHSLLPKGEIHQGVMIAQAGEYAQHLGRVDLSVEPHSGKVLHSSASVLPVPPGEPADPLVLAAIAAAEAETEYLMAEPLGVLQTSLDMDRFTECGIGDLVADVLRDRFQSEVALIASGQFHTGLPAGTVTLGDLDRACFSSANPCLTEVSGAQIWQALERGLDPDINQVLHHSYRGAPVGIPQISGMQVYFNHDSPAGQRVKRVLVNESPLEPERQYKLAHTDAEIIPQVGYLVLNPDQETRHEVPTIVREAIAEYLQGHSPTPPPQSGRWVEVGK